MGIRRFFKSLVARFIHPEEIHSRDAVIVILGPTGAGKSSFIKLATGCDVPIGHGLTCCTQSVTSVECQPPNPATNGKFIFIDTPAFNHDERTPEQIGKAIAKWRKRCQQSSIRAILYLHNISGPRMTELPEVHLKMFHDACGEGSDIDPSKITLVTTMGRRLHDEDLNLRESEIRRDYWKRMMAGGSRIMSFDDTPESAWKIVEATLRENDRHKTSVMES